MFCHHFPTLVELEITKCDDLRELPRLLRSLRELRISMCDELRELPLLPSLRELRISMCENLRELPQLLPSLRELRISECPKLLVLPSLPSVEILYLGKCDQIAKLSHFDHPSPSSSSSSSSTTTTASRVDNSFPCLCKIRIWDCPNLKEFPCISPSFKSRLPSALQELEIRHCKNLDSLPMGLWNNLTSLHLLVLYGLPKLKSLPEGLHKLTSLQIFIIDGCPAFEAFPDMGLPRALRDLSIKNCGKLNFLPKELHKLMNLQELMIIGCSSLLDCKNPEPLLYWGFSNLTTLESLAIGGFSTLMSIPKGMLPTNLKQFHISDCPSLESLHDGLSELTSLEYLDIDNCPILAQMCREEAREEWSMIAHIRAVLVDGQLPKYRPNTFK